MRTFDLLTNLIKEMNLFGEDAIECGKHLNLKPEHKYYTVTEVFEGQEYECYQTEWIPGGELCFTRKNTEHIDQINNKKKQGLIHELMEKQSLNEQTESPQEEVRDLPGNWEVEFEKHEYEIVERKGKTIIIQPNGYPKVQYRLRERGTRESLVF